MSDNKIYKTTTKDIGVSVEPFYLDKERLEQSVLKQMDPWEIHY